MNLDEVLQKYQLPLAVGLAGAILVGVGVFLIKSGQSPHGEGAVEILSVSPEVQTGSIFVDLEGAVESPGVYELPSGSRINDLLIRAGGLSAKADREWVSKNLNLAQKLSDGAKLFIPETVDEAGEARRSPGEDGREGININIASAVLLDTLWGIGESRAAAIIANRPYQTLEELMTKAGIPKNVFERIKEEITLY